MEQIERLEWTSPPQEAAEESAWLASRLLRRQVVDVSSAEPSGRVVDLVFDPTSRQVIGLVVRDTPARTGPFAAFGRMFSRRRTVATIGLDHIISMDGDVVTVNTNPYKLAPSRELERMPHLNAICEMAILTGRGICLGTLADLLLDDQGTSVSGFVVSPTASGEDALPALAAFASLPPEHPDATNQRLRVIPAESNVRVGGSLILLMSDVEPLREVVVIAPQTIAKTVTQKGA